MVLDASGGQSDVLELLQRRSAELAGLGSVNRDREAADLICRWFAEDQVWVSALPPLVQAAARGHLSDVASLLGSGSSPNEADGGGWSALHAAATRGFPTVVSALLDAGASVDMRSTDGFTPLLNASGPCEVPAVISLLLEAGADPNATDDTFGWRPLSRAAEHCRSDTVQLLIAAGADVRWVEPAGFTPLMTAAEHGCLAVISVLLEAGVDRYATFGGETAADIARRRGFDDCAALLGGDRRSPSDGQP